MLDSQFCQTNSCREHLILTSGCLAWLRAENWTAEGEMRSTLTPDLGSLGCYPNMVSVCFPFWRPKLPSFSPFSHCATQNTPLHHLQHTVRRSCSQNPPHRASCTIPPCPPRQCQPGSRCPFAAKRNVITIWLILPAAMGNFWETAVQVTRFRAKPEKR